MLDTNVCQDAPRAQLPSADRGFSMIEMMVVIAVAGVLLAFAAPSFRTIIGNSQMSATVNDLVFGLQTARSEAIKRAGPVALCRSATPLEANARCDGASLADGWIVYADRDASGTLTGADELILQAEKRNGAFAFTPDMRFETQVRFSDTGASTNVAGIPVSGDIVIDYRNGEEMRTISIAANGRVSSADSGGQP